MKSIFRHILFASAAILCVLASATAQWTAQTSGTTQTLLGASFTDSLTGKIVGTAGVIKRTTNAGVTWSTQPSGTALFLRDIYYSSPDTGTIVGESGLILRSTHVDSGWIPQTSGTSEHLVHVHFADNEHGIATGQNGTVRTTTNGGATWSAGTSGTGVELAGVQMIDTLRAYAVGFTGTIITSTDGGATWSPQASGTSATLRSVSFPDADTGYVVGYGGTILKTTDAGTNWIPQTSGTVNNLFAVYFSTGSVGTAVGTAKILRTTDGGATWVAQPVAFGGDLYDVEFQGGLRGWTVGQTGKVFFNDNGGTIVVTTPNGGQSWVPGSTRNITWSSVGVASVTIEYTTNLGSTWNFIATQPSTGTYFWLVPNTPSTQCLVRITSVASPTTADVSDAAFTIPDPPPFVTRRLVSITLSDDSGNARTDTFGVHEDATYCIDGQLDPDLREQQIPPPPPSGIMDFRFVEHRGSSNCIGAGLRVHLQEPYKLDTFRIKLQPDDADFPLHLSWPSGLAATGWDTLVLRDEFNGTFNTVNMLTDSTVTITNNLITTFNIVGSNRLDVPSITVDAPNGGETWPVGFNRLISWTSGGVAGVVIDYTTDQGINWNWITTQLSTGSYQWTVPNTPSTLCQVRIRAEEDSAIGDVGNGLFTIAPVQPGSATVQSKWNLVSIPLVVDDYLVSTLFPTAISQAFSWGGWYVQRNTLDNGSGFWVKFDSAQEVPFVGAAVLTDSVSVIHGWNLIGSISDPVAVNAIASVPGGMSTSKFYSYASGYVEADTIEPGKGYWVRVDLAGSLILGAAGPIAANNRINIQDVGENPPPPPGDEEVVNAGIPREVSLRQNYPNPFNPSTTIQFALPAATDVRLAVYNVVGEVVDVLVDGVQPAGYKSIEWDASAFPSGVYYLRLDAGGTIEMKKLILLR